MNETHDTHETSYALLTAARNESAFLPATIEAVIHQTRSPQQWIIVNDGSTDDTGDIIRHYAQQHPFIHPLERQADSDRNFGSKAQAINAARHQVTQPVDYIGVLDADVTFEPTFFEQLLDRADPDPQLGICGGLLYDRHGESFIPQITDTEWSVSGPLQLFRRACFDGIGGYRPVNGGVDAAAEIMARMNGWHVRAFRELRVNHHRLTGTEKHGRLGVFFHRGLEDRVLGYDPLFFMGRTARRVTERPPVLGSVLMLAGYTWAIITRRPIKLPPDVVSFLRREQRQRLRSLFQRGRPA